MAEPRDEHNREMVELWLLTAGQKVSTRPPSHPDEYHGRAGKRGERPGQDATWVDAISSPDAQRTDHNLRRIVGEMRTRRPWFYAILLGTYYGDDSDPAVIERWRRRGEPGDRILLGILEAAMAWIVDRLREENRVIYWPSPDTARSYTARQERKKREARYAYFSAIENGATTAEAFRAAVERSQASRTAVHYWCRGRRPQPQRGAPTSRKSA